MQIWVGKNGLQEIKDMSADHIVNCINHLNQRSHRLTCNLVVEIEKAIPKFFSNTLERNKLDKLIPQVRKYLLRTEDWIRVFNKELKRRKLTILVSEHGIVSLKKKEPKVHPRRR